MVVDDLHNLISTNIEPLNTFKPYSNWLVSKLTIKIYITTKLYYFKINSYNDQVGDVKLHSYQIIFRTILRAIDYFVLLVQVEKKKLNSQKMSINCNNHTWLIRSFNSCQIIIKVLSIVFNYDYGSWHFLTEMEI